LEEAHAVARVAQGPSVVAGAEDDDLSQSGVERLDDHRVEERGAGLEVAVHAAVLDDRITRDVAPQRVVVSRATGARREARESDAVRGDTPRGRRGPWVLHVAERTQSR